MTTDLQRAKTLLENQNYTCVLCRDEQIYTSGAGLFGLALQWALLPLIVYRVENLKKNDD